MFPCFINGGLFQKKLFFLIVDAYFNTRDFISLVFLILQNFLFQSFPCSITYKNFEAEDFEVVIANMACVFIML